MLALTRFRPARSRWPTRQAPARRDVLLDDDRTPAATAAQRPKTACACGGGCSKCRSQPRAEAPHGTDDLDNTDLSVPRATGDAGVPAPMDAGADAGAPVASCCDRAFSAGLAQTDYGGVICCNNVKHSCVWPSNMSSALTNATARSISVGCAREHEDTHHNDINCTGAAVERPGFKPGANQRAEECTAYTTEVACFDRRVGDCRSDAECRGQITSRRAVKQGQANDNCA